MHRSIMMPLMVPLLLLCLLSAASADDSEWMGQTRSVTGSEPVTVDPTKVISLSWRPRAFLYKEFLTDEECDHLISLAKNKLHKSTVVDHKSGKSVESSVRTSSGMFLSPAQDDIVKRVEDKIAAWTFLPAENGEALQVLKYEIGQKYEPHVDYYDSKLRPPLGGARIATVLMYLSDVIKGGETVFPHTEDTTFKDDTWSECGKRGLGVKPRKGDALLFYGLYLDASPDEGSAHQGCPVIEGEKWSATKWIHVSSRKKKIQKDCVDENDRCVKWALFGECEKNPDFMVGSKASPGSCRKSCKQC